MSNPTVGQFRAIWQGILDRLSGQAGKAQVQDADVKDAIDALRQVDFSTEAGQDAIKAVLDLVKLNTDSIKNKDFSTSAKQDLIVDALDALKIDTTAIKGKDFATDTTLAQVKDRLSGQAGKAQVQDADVKDAIDALRQVDFSTEAGQDAIKAALDLVKLNTDSIKNKDFSTSAKQDLIVDVLDALKIDTTAIKGKDFATDTTLAQVKSELEAVKAELQAVKANQTSGDQKVQLSGALTELFGESLSDRPPANSVSVGATFMVVGDTVVYQSNGSDWVVISE